MRYALRIVGLAGAILFSTAFIFTFSVPEFVENIGKDFIKNKIEAQTREKIERLTFSSTNTTLNKFADKILKNNHTQIEQLQNDLKFKAHEKLAEVVAKMRDLSCECRTQYEKQLERDTKAQILTLQNANEKLTEFMQYKYMEVANKLKTDLRIFTGSNVVIFMLLLIISFFKPQAIIHLFLPGILLVISTLVCSYFYLFEQNWFFTIIYDTYLGWGYLLYLGFVFGFLCDIVFNGAKITTEIINSVLEAIGSTLTVVSC